MSFSQASFVGQIDTQLLETVVLQSLEAVNVQGPQSGRIHEDREKKKGRNLDEDLELMGV